MVLTETKQFGGCVFMTLNDLKIGQSGIITAVGGEGALLLRLWTWDSFRRPGSGFRRWRPWGTPFRFKSGDMS